MLWPADHPVLLDPGLRPWRDSAEDVCGTRVHETVLRYLPGRRVVSRMRDNSEVTVLKVFGGPRARGNHRRLSALAASPTIAHLVPRCIDVDASGHAMLITYSHGRLLEQVGDHDFVSSAEQVGRALRQLHNSDVNLDRSWTWQDEIEQLDRRATARTRDTARGQARRTEHLAHAVTVPSHRDLHPRQVVVAAEGVRFIDLDDAAMAPAALDVGNFLAHLRRDTAIGRRAHAVTESAAAGFLAGYHEDVSRPGPSDQDVLWWERLAMTRLAGLAESRHGRTDWARSLHDLARGADSPLAGSSAAARR